MKRAVDANPEKRQLAYQEDFDGTMGKMRKLGHFACTCAAPETTGAAHVLVGAAILGALQTPCR